jgi:hypothetical protein
VSKLETPYAPLLKAYVGYAVNAVHPEGVIVNAFTLAEI